MSEREREKGCTDSGLVLGRGLLLFTGPKGSRGPFYLFPFSLSFSFFCFLISFITFANLIQFAPNQFVKFLKIQGNIPEQ
jgi:hypothetical protein